MAKKVEIEVVGNASSSKNDGGKKSEEMEEAKLEWLQNARKKFMRKHNTTGGGSFQSTKMKGVPHKKLKSKVKTDEFVARKAVDMLAENEILDTNTAGYLEAENDMERTKHITQKEILENTDLATAAKKFDFRLDFGPYYTDYSQNGRYLLTGGSKGQVAMVDCHTMDPKCEIQVQESIRAVKFLHTHQLFAVAQKKHTYIYDDSGLEIHCLKDFKYPTRLEYLPYHYLLAMGSDMDQLAWRDVSTGQIVANHKTRTGKTNCMRVNPQNAVLHCGTSDGVVSMWTPNLAKPAMQMLTHRAPVTALAVHQNGNYMTSAGADGKWKVWDLRKLECVHGYHVRGPAVSDIDISMNGIVSTVNGSHCNIWKDVFTSARAERPYMVQEFAGDVLQSCRFRPYEDVMAYGSSAGFGSLVVPGAGYGAYDAFESNPFESTKQRRETEVRKLLEKLQPETIMLDQSTFGSVKPEVGAVPKFVKEKVKKIRNKQRGKSKAGRKMKAKTKTSAVALREKIQAKHLAKKEDLTKKSKKLKAGTSENKHGIISKDKKRLPGGGGKQMPEEVEPTGALSRFSKKAQRIAHSQSQH